MSRHPGPDQLLAFATGQAPEDSAAQISIHLADCESCRTKIDALPSDTLLSLLRKSSSSPEAGGDRQAVTAAGAPVSPAAGADIPAELASHPKYHVMAYLAPPSVSARFTPSTPR
jgi:anti-sigma factor ChrR (cupin superfamily)